MQGNKVKSFLVSHPKLFELVFAGTLATTIYGLELQGVAGNPGP